MASRCSAVHSTCRSTPVHYREPPPKLGQHSDEIARSVGTIPPPCAPLARFAEPRPTGDIRSHEPVRRPCLMTLPIQSGTACCWTAGWRRMRDGSSDYGMVEDGALAWKDGLITYAGPRAQLPGDPERLAARSASTPLATGSRPAWSTATRTWCSPATAPRIRAAPAGRQLRTDRPRRRRHPVDRARDPRGQRSGTVRRSRCRAPRALLRRWRDDAGDQVRLRPRPRQRTQDAARRAPYRRSTLGITVRTTFLGAHALPPEYAGRADDYIEAAVRLAVHAARRGPGGRRRRVLRGHRLQRRRRPAACSSRRPRSGLPVKLHADQLSDLGGAALAAEFGGLSADHVEHSSAKPRCARWRMPAPSRCCCPAPSTCCAKPSCRRCRSLRGHGVPMAVATDSIPARRRCSRCAWRCRWPARISA